MDEESEKELSIERLLHQGSFDSYCAKIKDDVMKCLFVNIGEQLKPVVNARALECLKVLENPSESFKCLEV